MMDNIVIRINDHTGQLLFVFAWPGVTISTPITARVPFGFHGFNITVEPASDLMVKDYNAYSNRFRV